MKYSILLNCAELYLQCIYRDSLISVFPWKYWYHNFRNFIFRQPVKKFSRFTYIHAFYQERCDISFTTNILYVWTHINLMFHVLSLHRSNTVFSHHYITKNMLTKHDALPSLSQTSWGSLLEYGIFIFTNEWHAVNFRNETEL